MKNVSLKKILFALFAITETTDRGKRWKRIELDNGVKWTRVIKMTPGV